MWNVSLHIDCVWFMRPAQSWKAGLTIGNPGSDGGEVQSGPARPVPTRRLLPTRELVPTRAIEPGSAMPVTRGMPNSASGGSAAV
jgi:hypothetical protein